MKVISKVTTERAIADIVEAVRSGEHIKQFKVGDILEINGISHAIIGIDVEEGLDHSMTIQRIDHIYDRIFSYVNNKYATSDIREFLNTGYAADLPAEFVDAIKPVKIDNMDGEELFFLLSSKDLDLETSKYPYYHDRRNRIKFDEDGFATWWWLRDPYPGTSHYVRGCSPDGAVGSYIAYHGDRGLAPACVIA